ncbi:MAG: hypothetical protein WD845_03325 [Pirellulales bacterium]
MSRTLSQSSWMSYWFMMLAAAAAVCLPSRPNRAEVQLAPAYPPTVEAALPVRIDIAPPDAGADGLARSGALGPESMGGPQLTLELLAPDSSDASPGEPQPVAPQPDSLRVAKIQPAEVPAVNADAATPGAAASPATSAATQLTPELIALRDKVRRVLAMYFPRHQNARDNNAWEVMHAIIAYGVDTQIYQDGPGSEKVNAIGHLCFNYPCAGDRMLFVNGDKIEARRGVGVQGHHGQFLAILAQSHVKGDYPMHVSGKSFTLQDLIHHEKENCYAGEELTFKLISLMHYLDSDDTWKSKDGQDWSIQRLVREELSQPIRGAACGGTHRLMGFSYAVNKRLQRGKPIVGEFSRAQTFINDYHRYTLSLQNPDGSFSTEWFVRKGSSPDIDRRLKTSGHILEWISFSLPQSELTDPRMAKAVDYVATLLETNSKHTWEIGPLGHGLHALAIYDSRLFKPADNPPPQPAIVETSSDSDSSTSEARRTDGAVQ